MRPNVIPLLVFSLFLSLPISSAARPTDEADLLRLQHTYFEKIRLKDVDGTAALLADAYIGVYSDGIIDRDHEITDLKAFAQVLSEYKLSQEKVIFPNDKTGIVSFRLHVKVTVNKKDFFEDDNVACVWTRQKSTWRLSSQAAVKIKEDHE